MITSCQRSLAVSFAADIIASPSATKRLATGVAAPVNDDDHFMAADIIMTHITKTSTS